MKLIFLLKLTYSSLMCIRIYYKFNYHFYPVSISINFNCKNKNKKSFFYFLYSIFYTYIYIFFRIPSFASNSFCSSILLLTNGYCSNIKRQYKVSRLLLFDPRASLEESKKPTVHTQSSLTF